MNTKAELVCPVGNWSALKSVVTHGADSVYFGIKGLTMRNYAGNFDILELPKLMTYLHDNGEKGYLALNTIIYNNELTKVKRILTAAHKAGVDAVILWDMAVFNIAQEIGIPIHLSTQASVANIDALQWYSKCGVKRAVLARECSLNQIKDIQKEIQKRKLTCEIEVFVHGAMCLSVSGRCFMSQYTHHTSANRGECYQPCRREYKITDVDKMAEYTTGSDYILSPRDLCTIDFIDEILTLGVSACKIEGRMRSPEYAQVVTESYRRALDSYYNKTLNQKLKNELKQNLSNVYNRGFSSGFYYGDPEYSPSRNLEHGYEKSYCGEVIKYFKHIQVAEVIVRSQKIAIGDKIIILGKKTPAIFMTITELQRKHLPVASADKGDKVGIKILEKVNKNDKLFLWKKKE